MTSGGGPVGVRESPVPADTAGPPPLFAMSETKQPLRIVCDSREQDGFQFAGYPVELMPGTLATGDYSVKAFENRIAVERKSLPDLVACLGPERKRFEAELSRLRGFDSCAVVVEQPQAVFRLGQYRSRMDAGAAWQSVIALSMRYRVPFFWAENRADAERICFDCLRHFARDRFRELQALRIPATMPPERTGDPRPGAGADESANAPEGQQRAKVEPVPRMPHHE
jgi:DNA excision repair protein ERCC-4